MTATALALRQVNLPATYTPDPQWTATPFPTFTLRPTNTATPTSTPTATSTATFTPARQTGFVPAYNPNIRFYDTLPATTPCEGNGTVVRSQLLARSDGAWHSYHAYLPNCYGVDGRVYPVIYLIHGSIQTDTHWLDLGLQQLLDTGIRAGRFPPLIAIMPYSGNLGNITSGGAYSVEGVIVNDLIPMIDRTLCTWSVRQGRQIGGISRGGYWALEIAFQYPWLFQGVAGHSSHLRFETDAAKYNPLATYATSNLAGLRIWMDLGETDFLRPGQDDLHQKLTNAGIPHDYHINAGGHNDRYWATHLDSYIRWHTMRWTGNRTTYPTCSR